MNRPLVGTLVLLGYLCCGDGAFAQQFEKNSAANIFGPNGPQVPIYSASGAKSSTGNERGNDEMVPDGDPRLGAKAFLEEKCKQVGPKSSACAELAALEGRAGSGTTRKLGFDPGEDDANGAPLNEEGWNEDE